MAQTRKDQAESGFESRVGAASIYIDKYLHSAVFALLALLLFFPPFFRGLYFVQDVFVLHIVTAGLVFLLCLEKIKKRDYSFIRTPMDWAALAFAAAYLLSLFNAVHIGEALYGFLRVLNLFLIYWMVSQVSRDYPRYMAVLKVLLLSGTGVALIGILAAAGFDIYPGAFQSGLLMSTLQYHNTTAAYLAALSLIGIALWILEKRKAWRIIYGLAVYLMMVVTFSTISKGAWLVFAVGSLMLLTGMPGAFRAKSIYHLFVTAVIAFFASGKFISLAGGETPSSGLLFIAAGALLIILAQFLWEKGQRFQAQIKKNRVYAFLLLMLIAVLIGAAFKSGSAVPGEMVKELAEIGDIQHSSYATRLDFIRWGLAIAGDYPLSGTGAGGWAALYHSYQDTQYWSREVHNHFLQIGVEAGMVGLAAYLSVWVIAAAGMISLYRHFKNRKSEESASRWVLHWSTFSTAVVLGIHSAFDFDFSLAAIFMLLWILLALLNSAYLLEKPPLFSPGGKKNLAFPLLMAAILLLSGTAFRLAYNYDRSTQEILMAANTAQADPALDKAENFAVKASGLDPLNASYHAHLADLYALRFQRLKVHENPEASAYYENSLKEIRHAARLSPYDITVQSILANSAQKLGDIDLFIEHVKAVLRANPNAINIYEVLLRSQWRAVLRYEGEGNGEKARAYAADIIKSRDRLERQLALVSPVKPYWQGDKLELTPLIQLNTARAYYAQGEYGKARREIEPMWAKIQDYDQYMQKELWACYAAVLYRQGESGPALEMIENTGDRQLAGMFQNLLAIGPTR